MKMTAFCDVVPFSLVKQTNISEGHPAFIITVNTETRLQNATFHKATIFTPSTIIT
jgi:hypothetical protein